MLASSTTPLMVSSSVTPPPLLIHESAGARLIRDSAAGLLIRNSIAFLLPLHTPLTHRHRRRPELHPGGVCATLVFGIGVAYREGVEKAYLFLLEDCCYEPLREYACVGISDEELDTRVCVGNSYDHARCIRTKAEDLMRTAGLLRISQSCILPMKNCVWKPPSHGFLKLNCDGAVDLETGMASAGGLFQDDKRSFSFGISKEIIG
ncbi:hypothetical protein Syun_024999 [Stephania yunnanensis]|uniref:RNase H type-1 domain-containing protein n=1 Tax=Stephania yunnanensis TaxID=152371 RepID=A0AAP0ERA1_9MAGN